MPKILHTLRFQLPAVALGVFAGILFLVALFFHEMNSILVKTGQLAQSAEISDHVATWINTLSASARERTKLMSLGEETYLRSFQITLNEAEGLYASIGKIGADPAAASTRQLRDLHDRQLEYMELLDGFAKDQAIRRKAERALAETSAKGPAAGRAAPARRPHTVPHARKPGAHPAGKARKAAARARKPRRAAPSAGRPAAPPPAFVTPKQVDLDSATNETFKNYEAVLRDGLNSVQDTMRAERKDKLRSLRLSVGRAKDRLVYSLLLLLAVVAYVAAIMKWKILDPMGRLKQGAMEIGKGALGYQVKVDTRNEMGELAEVFNHMSLQLDQKRNAEVRLKRLEAIEQIVRSVNHEINNPLMIISGNAEYLLAVYESADAGTRAKLESILSEVRRIFLVTQRLKEIKEPVTQDYIGARDQMIDLARASQVRPRDF
jgi:hypothetical protein